MKKWKTLTGGRPFLLKGIQCAEDAIKAIEAGCDGVIVSNHAGRQVDGAIGSLDALPEVSPIPTSVSNPISTYSSTLDYTASLDQRESWLM